MLLVLACFAPASWAQAPAAPPQAVRDNLRKAASELAKAGRVDELKTVMEVLETLGEPAEATREQGARLMAAAAKVPRPGPAAPAAKALEGAVKALAGWLDSLAGDSARRAAEAIVALDDQHEAACRTLGRTRVDGRWVDGLEATMLARRRLLARALADARRLPVPIGAETCLHPAVVGLSGEGHVSLKHGDYSLHTDLPREKGERIFRETLRAVALANWLLGGELGIPAEDRDLVLFEKRSDYRRSVEWAIGKGWLEPEDKEYYQTGSTWYTPQRHVVSYMGTEAHAECNLMYLTLWMGPLWPAQPVLRVGLCNWIGLAYLGRPLPVAAWVETKEGGLAGGRTATKRSASAEAEFESIRRLGEAGIAGSKAFMAWLARREEDPPWSAGFLDQDGRIGGEERLKATTVVEYLFERSVLEPVIRETCTAAGSPDERTPAFEKALGEPLGQFERKWRRWILSESGGGVIQRLSGGTPETVPLTAEDQLALKHLNSIRSVAFGRPAGTEGHVAVTMEPSLSEGCRRHGRYLERHPEQASEWPGAHEEYPDREGFSPEGCRAGGASVIAPGARGPVEAIDGWMATYYHRLPLLHPGLLRVGWGREGGYACLDAGSMVGKTSTPEYTVVWPADGQTGVPLAFQPELPNPVPGQDQASFGYPVTLQLFAQPEGSSTVLNSMTLTAPGGSVVDCWFTSPENPLNPELAPEGTWGLIPKARLNPGARYRVEAVLADRKVAWTFVTCR